MSPLIPKPRHVRHIDCLQTAMRLHQNLQKYKELMAFLREIATDMLDLGLTFRKQDRAKWKACVERAITEYPFFNRYQDQWPVHVYLKMYLRHTAFRTQKAGTIDQRESVDPDEMEEEHEVASEDIRPFQAAVLVPPMQAPSSGSSSLNPRRNGMSSSMTPSISPPAAVSSSSSPPSVVPLSPAPLSTVDATTIASARQGQIAIGSFQAFLRMLEPDSEQLAARFENAGMSNVGRLRNVAEWPEEEQEMFLKQDVGLNQYEYRQVRVAMTRWSSTLPP